MTSEFLPFGFLPVHKPSGPTSHDVVARVRRLLPKGIKVGHTGTLDPFASGVMILAIGKATRFADDVHLLPKSYRAEIQLGRRTDTLDLTGSVDLECPVPNFEQADLDALILRFSGKQSQVPPRYSAKKVDGQRSYELARKQVEVELKSADIEIFQLALERSGPDRLICETRCSTGTYIRSLGRDIGAALGSCAHLTALSRTSVGAVSLSDCCGLAELKPDLLTLLWPVERLLPELPVYPLPETAQAHLMQGRAIPHSASAPLDFLCYFRDDLGVSAVFRCGYDPVLGTVNSKMLCYSRST